MIALWLKVCLLGTTVCHTTPIVPDFAVGLARKPLEAPASVMACQTAAPALVASWRAAHGNRWQVASWRCGPEERGA